MSRYIFIAIHHQFSGIICSAQTTAPVIEYVAGRINGICRQFQIGVFQIGHARASWQRIGNDHSGTGRIIEIVQLVHERRVIQLVVL